MAECSPTFHSWFGAQAVACTRKRKLGHNTRLIVNGDPENGASFAVRFHDTDIVTFHPDGRIVLDSGGWRTLTTRDRMNQYLPAGFRVYTERSVMYLYQGISSWGNGNGREWPFSDGLVILDRDRQGTDYKVQLPDGARTVEDSRKLNKAVGAYSREYARALVAGEIGLPGAGDCFMCQFPLSAAQQAMDRFAPRDGSTVSFGAFREAMQAGRKALQSATFGRSADHILSHVEESYHVPSLALLAMIEFGASPYTWSKVVGIMAGKDFENPHNAPGLERDVAKHIRKYCKRLVGLGN